MLLGLYIMKIENLSIVTERIKQKIQVNEGALS